ncbi:MAG: nucleotidyltransferase domain-containing protein [Patescibacteria group bacterium]
MLDAATVLEIKNILFKFLDPQKDKVFIFGSRAVGKARKFSDIDIGVKSERQISLSLLSDIEEAFEESNIPYTVDVVDFSAISKNFENVAIQKIIKLN